jgi:hypothetical protein
MIVNSRRKSSYQRSSSISNLDLTAKDTKVAKKFPKSARYSFAFFATFAVNRTG